MRFCLLAPHAVAALLVAATAAATPPAAPVPVRSAIATHEAPHAAPAPHPTVAAPAAPHAPAPPPTIHLSTAHASTEAPAPVSKADPKLVDFAKTSFMSRRNDDRPYRLSVSGEGPDNVKAARDGGARVFVVTSGPGGEPLPRASQLFIVRKLFSTTIHDSEGNVVASGHDQVPGYGADHQHSESADWSGKPLGAALKLPASAKQAPNPGLPSRNPDVKNTGGGSFPYTVPLAGTKARVLTRDASKFFAGGEETTDEGEWGGRATINQPYENGRFVVRRVVNLKAIVDARTGEPVTETMALEIDGQLARYEPRTRGDSRPDLTLQQVQALVSKQGPGPLF